MPGVAPKARLAFFLCGVLLLGQTSVCAQSDDGQNDAGQNGGARNDIEQRSDSPPGSDAAPGSGSGDASDARVPPSPVAPLKRALALAEKEQWQQARTQLAPLFDSPLRPHAALLEGRWLRRSGDLAGAERTLRKGLSASLPRDVAARLWMEVALVELDRQRFPAALEAQEQAWTLTHDVAAASSLAFELARAFEERSRADLAVEVYRKVWRSWPRSLEADDAYEAALRLEKSAGIGPAPVDSLVSLITDLRVGGRCELALRFLPGIRKRRELDATEKRTLREEHAECLFATRRYTEAIPKYQALAKESSGEDRVEASIQAARARVRAGQQARGIRELSAIARTAEEPQAARARYLVALLIDQADPKSSARLLEQVASQTEDRRLAADADWQLAWADIERRRWASARRHLRPLTEGPWNDIEVQRARYWHAVALESAKPDAGRDELRMLARSVPLTYYGMLASDRLGETPTIERSLIEGRPSSQQVPLALQRAGWLQEAGLSDLARDELTSWRLSGRLDRDERLAGALALHELGEHYHAARLVIDGFGDALEQGIDPSWKQVWLAAWHRPFGAPVEQAVSEFQFDEALVYAIMREESLYRPQVQSGANARGLMQLVPPTAQRIARSLGIPSFDPEVLYEPEVNVRFGTYYLKQLMGQFNGSRPLAIAAYNAGPEAVYGWTSAGQRKGTAAIEIDRFVDSVPYNETRRYLRRVLRSYRVYRLLYGESLRSEGVAADSGGRTSTVAETRDAGR